MVLPTSYASSQTDNNIDFQYVPKDFVTTEHGYWANEYSGKTILQALRTYRLESEHWQESYNTMYSEYQAFAQTVDDKISKVEKDIKTERAEWKKAIRKARAPGFGVFAGPAYDFHSSKVNLVIGAGLVWKLW